MDVQLTKTEALPLSDIAHELVGSDHGGVVVCIIFVNAPPAGGPSLHTHPYEEVFITLEGQATFVAGEQELQVGPGDVVIVPPYTARAFTNSDSGALRQIDIHVSQTFSTEWL